MNEVQALNILTNLANRAVKNSLFEDINDSGSVYTALVVLSQLMPPPPEILDETKKTELGPDDAGYHVRHDEEPSGD